MIEAHFDTAQSRMSAISGVYQYDTGQRLRLLGLPSPQELAGKDDFLSGDLPAVQAQFCNKGDSQAEMRLAVWNEARGSWLVDVPDELLTKPEPVYVYVYVYHGETTNDDGDDIATRAKTMYEGVFTPIGRPAPNNIATPEQWEAWEVKLTEVELATATTSTAENNALAEVEATRKAAQSLEKPTADVLAAGDAAAAEAQAIKKMDDNWEKTTIEKTALAPGSEPKITVEKTNGVRHIVLGIPQGADGAKGEPGDKGPSDVTFVLDGTTLYTTTTATAPDEEGST